MKHDIGVAMTCKTAVMGNLTTHEQEWSVVFGSGEAVDVESVSDSDRGHRIT
jgi:hypothetical protein